MLKTNDKQVLTVCGVMVSVVGRLHGLGIRQGIRSCPRALRTSVVLPDAGRRLRSSSLHVVARRDVVAGRIAKAVLVKVGGNGRTCATLRILYNKTRLLKFCKKKTFI